MTVWITDAAGIQNPGGGLASVHPATRSGRTEARPPYRHSRPHPIVIPAKAGIHPRPTATPGYTGVLDSGLRRNDGGGGCGMPTPLSLRPNLTVIPTPYTVIPAKAGIHPRHTTTPGYTGVLDSGLRRNDGGGGCGMPTALFLLPARPVIPAKAGIHTCPSGFRGYPPEYAPTVIPARAGIQNPGLPPTAERPGCGFPLSRE